MTIVSCDSAKQSTENPFFGEWDTPYGVPPFDRIRPEHYMPAFERGMSLQLAEIDAITSNNDEPTFENVILAYDDSGRMLAPIRGRQFARDAGFAGAGDAAAVRPCRPHPTR